MIIHTSQERLHLFRRSGKGRGGGSKVASVTLNHQAWESCVENEVRRVQLRSLNRQDSSKGQLRVVCLSDMGRAYR